MRDEALLEESCNRLIFSMLNKSVARFRVNVYRQKGSYAACLRALGSTIPSIELLNLPPVVVETSRNGGSLMFVVLIVTVALSRC